MNRTRLILYWLPPLLWAAVIWWLTNTPGDPEAQPMLFPHFDKAAHFGVFFLLGGLLMNAFRGTTPLTWTGNLLCSLVLALSFGAWDEWHQRLVPYRSCELADWLFDAAGAIACCILLTLITKHGERPWLTLKNR